MRVNRPKSNNKLLNNTPPTVHNVFILDSSASMIDPKNNKYDAAVKGINLEVEELKAHPEINYTHSLVEFGNWNNIIKKCWMQEIKTVPPFIGKCFEQWTALYDAIGYTIEEIMLSKKPEDKILLKIFTDGAENDSKKYGSRTLKALMDEAKQNGFTITFEGTEADAAMISSKLGVDKSNIHTHDNTVAGVTRGVEARIAATAAYSKSVLAGEDVSLNFYTKSIN